MIKIDLFPTPIYIYTQNGPFFTRSHRGSQLHCT